MSKVRKKYIKIGSKKVFVQILGEGPALALLHPSPHNSNMLLPLAQKLASQYTVICVDTPGYGNSDMLAEAPKDISVYSDILHELFKEVKISTISIYGSATGAQIGIRFALDYPHMVSHLFLDNAAHFDDDLRGQIMEHYFPDLSPKSDGSHLDVLWDIVSNLFQYFPWCFKTLEFALNRPQLPAAVLHNIALDFLKVGANYDVAYRVAFEHERAEYVQQLNVPTSIIKWLGSIILPYVNDLVSHDFPNNVQIIELNKDPNERTEAMVTHMVSKSGGQAVYKFSEDLGEIYQETAKEIILVTPPEISADGSYLKEAWQLLSEKNKNATPEKIQEQLIHWYGY